MKNKIIYLLDRTLPGILIFFFSLCFQNILAQSYFATRRIAFFVDNAYKVQINDNSICSVICSEEVLGNTLRFGGLTMSPEGELFGLAQSIFIIDTITGSTIAFYNIPAGSLPSISGLVAISGGIFYTITADDIVNGIPGDSLLRIDTNSDIITNVGYVGWPLSGDITMFNGDFYYVGQISNPPLQEAIVKLDITDPSNNSIAVTLPSNRDLRGLTASRICNTLIATEYPDFQPLYINLIDGAIIPVCELPESIAGITTLIEFETPTICGNELDLDCDDSSGAVDADYNSSEYDCLSPGALISDIDIGMLYDDIISTVTVQISGIIPDAPFEVLTSSGSTPNIDVSGSGTDMITLTNAGGAKSTDFKDALQLIRYHNTASPLTPGMRTVEVQFTTESGSMSNIATAFIDVISIPVIDVDLGDDLQICNGETTIFDAGNPGSVFAWNTGSHNQTITTGTSGEYIVTVENGINCPGRDTVVLDVVPVVHVSLSGDDETCDNEQANLVITTDSPFPLDIEITPDPGSPFVLMDVEGTYTFFDLPAQSTLYTITDVVPSQDACVDITNGSQGVLVFSSYITTSSASLCEGDSIWLSYYWETEAGVYEIPYYSQFGCDSIVTYTITVDPAFNVTIHNTTCDSSAAGTFIMLIDNPNGCDTVITTTVTLLPSDTTTVSLTSCNLSSTGVFTQLLSNQDGCDSLIITNVSLIPPADTTSLQQTTCDSSLLGVFQQILPDQTSCDSLIITTITMAPADTSYLSSTSCDSAAIGVFQLLLSNQSGCDSLVITTVSAGTPDSTYLFTTSCDSASLGVFETHFISIQGCDSTVFNTVSYSASDSTFILSSSCDPDQTGVFIQSLVNRFGCDSIITETISLLPSSETFINSTTCDTSAAGDFVHTYINQAGCDSIVYETISLLPDSEIFLNSTTCSSAQAGTFITTHFNQYGCDSIVTLTVSLIPADTTTLTFKTCDPAQVGSIENTFTNQDGCDSLVIQQTSLYPLPELEVKVTSDFNGYDISCKGESDGSASADVTGVQPFTYTWSTGSPDQSITGLQAGAYSVTITDGNGCMTNGEIILLDPPPFMISFTVSQPDCFDQNNGSITVDQTGGVLPIRYSIDGLNFQSSPSFTGLSGGTYEVTTLDANDCEVKEIIWINVPLKVNVELGDDQTILPGDTAIIEAIVNVPYDSLASIIWSGLTNPNCPTCLSQPVVPIITTTYSVSVTSIDGCKDEDAMTLFLERNTDIYVPNIFSPNGDGINDRLLISAGDEVEEISSLIIFDRWGNEVYAAENFPANDPAYTWDGTLKGKQLNSAVFAYKMIVEFKDGGSEVRYGDVTLIK